MTPIHKISDTPPVFPCWLWSLAGYGGCGPHWVRYNLPHDEKVSYIPFKNSFTHWSPDAPTAPTEPPASAPQDVAARGDERSFHEKDEDAFHDWNRDVTDYVPTLWDAYCFGLARGRVILPQQGKDATNEGARGLVLKCFDHLGREMERMSLNESASTGTQRLRLELAQFLDSAPPKESAVP
jgi:hypothetical protein